MYMVYKPTCNWEEYHLVDCWIFIDVEFPMCPISRICSLHVNYRETSSIYCTPVTYVKSPKLN